MFEDLKGQTKELDKLVSEIEFEKEKFDQALNKIQDPISAILRTHLFVEHQLDRTIIFFLEKGEKLLKKGYLKFNQKVLIVEAFDFLNNQTLNAIKKLNSVRNNLAHSINFVVNDDVVKKIGRPFGSYYSDLCDEFNDDYETKLGHILPYLSGGLVTEIAVRFKEKNS